MYCSSSQRLSEAQVCNGQCVQVLFLSASEEINKSADKYWTSVMDIARRNNLNRIIRCSQIMGRTDTDDLSAAQILYPCMQCADIFYLQVRSGFKLPCCDLPWHSDTSLARAFIFHVALHTPQVMLHAHMTWPLQACTHAQASSTQGMQGCSACGLQPATSRHSHSQAACTSSCQVMCWRQPPAYA